MQITTKICDVCGKAIPCSKDFFTIKVKSQAFVNYYNFGNFFADRKTFDICRDCIKDFKLFVEKRREERKE